MVLSAACFKLFFNPLNSVNSDLSHLSVKLVQLNFSDEVKVSQRLNIAIRSCIKCIDAFNINTTNSDTCNLVLRGLKWSFRL
ncbi:hypothetical protein SAMN04490188_5587 [Pseudomonas kilonensis]|uniref:Uncharacterized protein n=1 Tax=Pseudomonas kilonensis TaxID=132476 RepID=A0ABY0ZIK8_9PSED|nr:hypothetical protein SAMN04490188_5587 [Pseudomonas kilonensis]